MFPTLCKFRYFLSGICYFKDGESEEFKVFMSVADGIDDVPFAHITDAAVAGEVGIKENGIVVFKKVCVHLHVCGNNVHR